MLFVKPMRKAEYVTMLDPFQQRYGARIGSLLFVPTLIGDLLWSAAVIKALGDTIKIITEIDTNICIFTSVILVIM